MENKEITWAAIQPLTGGMYLGTEEVIRKQAKYILSYPGLEEIIYDKKDQITGMGNERHLLEYLKNKKRRPVYLQFQQGMFDIVDNPIIKENERYYYDMRPSCIHEWITTNIDLIVAVPVCAGLSGANTQDHGKQDSTKNNNMKFISKYVLETIKPKAYIFENAPALYTFVGTQTRDYLNELAEKTGYSITYIRTNTNLHDNPQFRQRTFVIFWKWPHGKKCPPPDIDFHNHPMKDVIKFLERIPKDATQNDVKKDQMNEPLKNFWDYKFIKHKFGKNWRKVIGEGSLVPYIIDHNLDQEAIEFSNDERVTKHLTHCRDKRNQSKGWYDSSITITNNDHVPTIYFRSAHRILHPKEDRFYTMREIMSFMKMPYDFEYLHTWRSMGSVIGQNVPAGTIKDWIIEIKKVLDDWNNKRNIFPKTKKDEIAGNIYFHNNCNPKSSFYPNKQKQGFKFK